MTRRVLYVAHPLAPSEEAIKAIIDLLSDSVDQREATTKIVRQNVKRALCWLDWLRRSFPETTFIAPWIAAIMSGEDDADPKAREAGLVDACAVVERCDGIVLCGGRIPSGMRRERDHGLATGLDDSCEPIIQTFSVYDLTPTAIDNLIRFPTWSVLAGSLSIADWYEAIPR